MKLTEKQLLTLMELAQEDLYTPSLKKITEVDFEKKIEILKGLSKNAIDLDNLCLEYISLLEGEKHKYTESTRCDILYGYTIIDNGLEIKV